MAFLVPFSPDQSGLKLEEQQQHTLRTPGSTAVSVLHRLLSLPSVAEAAFFQNRTGLLELQTRAQLTNPRKMALGKED